MGGRHLILLRHAQAGERGSHDPDRRRPLSTDGRRQAKALVETIGPLRPNRILSSPYTRCLQTVEPLGRALGVRLEAVDDLGEGGRPVKLLKRLDDWDGVLMCSHGDELAALVGHLIDLGAPLHGALPIRKGAAWALKVVKGRVVRGRYLPPPV